jgi:hypothetical protein
VEEEGPAADNLGLPTAFGRPATDEQPRSGSAKRRRGERLASYEVIAANSSSTKRPTVAAAPASTASEAPGADQARPTIGHRLLSVGSVLQSLNAVATAKGATAGGAAKGRGTG